MKTTNNFEKLVKEELLKARRKHGKQHSYHEGYAILLEEVDELWEEVRRKSTERNHLATLKELVQIGACAQKMAEDVILPEFKKSCTKNRKSSK